MRRKPVAQTDEYQEVRLAGLNALGYSGETDERLTKSSYPQDCGVIAISLATGIPYDEVLPELVKRGLSMKRGANSADIRKALRSFGFRAIQIHQSEIIQNYPPAKRGKTFVTPRQVERFPAAWRGLPPILMWTEGHVLLVKDGKVHDWSAGFSIRAYRLDVVVPLGPDPAEFLRQHGLEAAK